MVQERVKKAQKGVKAARKRVKAKRTPRRAAGRGTTEAGLAEVCVHQWRTRFEERYLPRISQCLEQLSDEEVWWRPNDASNSIGNLVLHICGNMRQWIISGLGGAADLRERDKEFAECGPIARNELRDKFRQTVSEAREVLARLKPGELMRQRRIQGYDVTGYEAAAHVIEHVAYHAGQIIFITKLKRAKDLGFTQLPLATAKASERKLPL